ncbi:hypothetical protein [Luteolibacter sp. AS25]|uniref:hypothetical protein n=1 Tax=Luteolibacter sp. AS25 TaxID=3135776 RepID=UPI00398AD282
MKINKLLPLAALLTITSCSKEKENETVSSETSNDQLTAYLSEEKPAESTQISELRENAKPGDEVTFTGKVIGSHNVFMDGRAIMIMGDPTKLTSCDLHPGDNCASPWDTCCDDPDVIKQNIVTVQIVDESGTPLKSSIKGLGNLKELSTATVTGTVTEQSNAENMLINAASIYIEQ